MHQTMYPVKTSIAVARSLFVGLSFFSVSAAVSPACAQDHVMVRIGRQIPINDVVHIQGRLWVLAKGDGLYEVEGKTRLVPRFVEDLNGADVSDTSGIVQVRCIESVGNEVWIGTLSGVYRTLDGENFERIDYLRKLDRAHILAMLNDTDGKIWLGTSQGIYRISNDAMTYKRYLEEPVQSIVVLKRTRAGEILAAGTRDIYRLNATTDRFVSLSSEEPIQNVRDIFEVDNNMYMHASNSLSRGSLYKYANGKFESINRRIRAINLINEEEIWFSTGRYIMRWRLGRDERPQIVESLADHNMGDINEFFFHEGYVWFGTSLGIFRWPLNTTGKAAPYAVLDGGKALHITGFQEIDRVMWIWGETGVYRVYDDVEIHLNIFSAYKCILFRGNTLRIRHPRYHDPKGVLPEDVKQDFRFILDLDQNAFNRRLDEYKFSQVKETASIDTWKTKVYIAVRDHYGNIRKIHPRTLVIRKNISTWLYVSVIATLILLALCLLSVLHYMPVWLVQCVIVCFAILSFRGLTIGQILLHFPTVRCAIQKVYVKKWLADRGSHARGLVNRLETATSRSLILDPNEARDNTLNSIVYELAYYKGALAKLFPVEIELHDPTQDIESVVIKKLDTFIPFVRENFCRHVLHYADFVFLFTLKDGTKDLLTHAMNFVDDRPRKRSYVVISPYSSGEQVPDTG